MNTSLEQREKDRSGRQAGNGGFLAVTVALVLTAAPVYAESLATNVVLAGQPADHALTPSLGKPFCLKHDVSDGTASYYFRSGSLAIMSAVVNEVRSALDSSRVVAVTVTTRPPDLNDCAGPTQASLSNATYQLVTSKGHLQLGDSMDRASQVVGHPDAIDRYDGLIRFEYARERDLYHEDLWSLLFMEDRLVEWTIRTVPVFYEVGG